MKTNQEIIEFITKKINGIKYVKNECHKQQLNSLEFSDKTYWSARVTASNEKINALQNVIDYIVH